jgi:hypothetical protein
MASPLRRKSTSATRTFLFSSSRVGLQFRESRPLQPSQTDPQGATPRASPPTAAARPESPETSSPTCVDNQYQSDEQEIERRRTIVRKYLVDFWDGMEDRPKTFAERLNMGSNTSTTVLPIAEKCGGWMPLPGSSLGYQHPRQGRLRRDRQLMSEIASSSPADGFRSTRGQCLPPHAYSSRAGNERRDNHTRGAGCGAENLQKISSYQDGHETRGFSKGRRSPKRLTKPSDDRSYSPPEGSARGGRSGERQSLAGRFPAANPPGSDHSARAPRVRGESSRAVPRGPGHPGPAEVTR